MAGQIVNGEVNRLLDLSINGTWMAAFTAAPTEAGGGTEVTGGSYARIQPTFAAASSQAKTLSADAAFPEATGSWGSVVAVALMDASSAGNMRWWALLTTPGDPATPAPKTINQYDRLVIKLANFSATLD